MSKLIGKNRVDGRQFRLILEQVPGISLSSKKSSMLARSSLEGVLAPEAMGQQIGKASEDLPLRRRVRETVIESDIKDERFACRVADCPKIADGVAPEKRLREVPHFTGERKVLEERMRNRKRLSELTSPNGVLY